MTDELQTMFEDLPKPILKQIQSGKLPVLYDEDSKELCINVPVRVLADLKARIRELEVAVKKRRKR